MAKTAKKSARTTKRTTSRAAKPKTTTPKKAAPARAKPATAKSRSAKPAKKAAPAKRTKASARAPAKPRSKSTSRTKKATPATRKAARPASKATTKARKASRKTAKKPKTVKRAAKSTSKSKPTKKVAKKTAKKTSKRSRASKPTIDVKMPTVGTAGRPAATSGLSFLAGKPGSAGAANAAVNDKPHLTKTKLGSRELAKFRDLLIAKRRQLLRDMEGMEREALQGEGSNFSHLPVHMADVGTDVYEQEFTLSLVHRDRKIVDEIDHALGKIDKKSFGICEGTGQMIAKSRLEAQPWTRYSIEYARHRQRPGIRREE